MLRSSAFALMVLLALAVAPARAAGPDPSGASGAAPTASTLTWTGLHAGGFGGFSIEPVTRTSTNTISSVVTDSSFKATGGFGGGRGGYTLRTTMGIVGVEADEMASAISGTFNGTNASGTATSTTVNKTKMFGSARGIYSYSLGQAVLNVGAGVGWHSVTATRTQVLGQVNNAPQGTVETIPVSNAGFALSADVSKQIGRHLAFTVGYLYEHFSHTSITPLSLVSSSTSTPVHVIVAGVTYVAR